MTKYKKRGKLFKLKVISTALLVISLPLLIIAVKITSTQMQSHAAITSYYFSQYSQDWQKSNCDIKSYGCFPTSLAMALKKTGVDYINPLIVARAIGSGCKDGTNVSEADKAMNYVNSFDINAVNLRGNNKDDSVVTYGKKRFNYDLAKEYINNGYVLLLGGCMKYYHTYNTLSSTPGPHAVLVTNVNPSKHSLTMLDPTKEFGTRNFNGDDDIYTCVDHPDYYYFVYALKNTNQ